MKENYKASVHVKMSYETKVSLVKMAVKQNKSSEQLATDIFNEAFKKVVNENCK